MAGMGTCTGIAGVFRGCQKIRVMAFRNNHNDGLCVECFGRYKRGYKDARPKVQGPRAKVVMVEAYGPVELMGELPESVKIKGMVFRVERGGGRVESGHGGARERFLDRIVSE